MGAIRQQATFGGGCFWCTEAVFKRVKGVQRVTPGYAGGTEPHPSYQSIHYRSTGHAEVVQIEYDPDIVSYETIIKIFFGTHDPTQVNGQGNDTGPEYRSIILYHNDDQQRIAESVKQKLEQNGVYNKPIVTEIRPLDTFTPAEEEHHNFYEKNSSQPYCQVVIRPKVRKLREQYQDYFVS